MDKKIKLLIVGLLSIGSMYAQKVERSKSLPNDILDAPIAVNISTEDYILSDRDRIEAIKKIFVDWGLNVTSFGLQSNLNYDPTKLLDKMKVGDPKYYLTMSYGNINSSIVVTKFGEQSANPTIYGMVNGRSAMQVMKKFAAKIDDVKKINPEADKADYDGSSVKEFNNFKIPNVSVVEHLPKDLKDQTLYVYQIIPHDASTASNETDKKRIERVNKRLDKSNELMRKSLAKYPYPIEYFNQNEIQSKIDEGAKYFLSFTIFMRKGVKWKDRSFEMEQAKRMGDPTGGGGPMESKISTTFDTQPIIFDMKNEIMYIGTEISSSDPWGFAKSLIKDTKKMEKGKYEFK